MAFQRPARVSLVTSFIILTVTVTIVIANVPTSPSVTSSSDSSSNPGSSSDYEWRAKVPKDLRIDVQGNNLSTGGSSNPSNHGEAASSMESLRYSVASFDFNHVATPYIISLWIIIVGLAKIGFHVTPKLSSICPESVVLMILGVLIGILLFYGGIDKPSSSSDNETPSFQQPLTPNIFFLYMLPPIVMDAGYHMPNRLFFDNLMSILMYAVLGTIWNALTIGICLYLCAQTGMFGVQIPLLDTLLFSSIVSAVDPVAVLAVFEEIHVNEVLYILVFGESLLNDAVTVVLYHMFEGYTEMGAENILPVDFAAGFASFFVISLGGTLMGVIWGFAAAFVSRFTHHVKIIEPIFVFVMAYLSYLSAEMFHLSGILALTFCGITMKNYVEENITETSQTTLKYAMKMLANSSESVIFLFLGVCTVTDTHDWNTMFVILTIVFALIFRALGVVLFTAIANRFRLHKLTGIEQFIMSYGGLRGAVAFALVLVVNEQIIPTKKMMVTTIIAIVYFTVFLQGMTIGPLVKILKVPRAQKYEMSMNERIHNRLMDHIMAGIEDISGMMIGNYKLRDKFRHFNNLYLKHWFLRDSHERGNSSRKIFETYSRLNLQDAINIVNKQNLLSMYNNNNHNQEKTLTSLFRTYTESNFSAGSGGNTGDGNVKDATVAATGTTAGGGPNSSLPPSFTSICIDNAPNNAFNFDLANLDYSPSNRDLAEAEIHHILSDNMFKPVRRYRKYNKCDLPENGHLVQFQHMDRHQVGYLMSQNLKKRRKTKVKTFDNNGQEIHPSGQPSVTPESGMTSDTHLGYGEAGDVDIGITFSVGSNRNSPRKDHSGTYHHQQHHQHQHHHHHHHHLSASGGGVGGNSGALGLGASGMASGTAGAGGGGGSGGHNDSSLDDAPRTAVEAILPWRRNSSFGPAANQENSEDNTSMVLKQEEFPPWITNKDYLPNNYASPTNTMLEALDRDRQNSCHKIPHVHDIFQASGSTDAPEDSTDRSVGLDLTELNANNNGNNTNSNINTNTNNSNRENGKSSGRGKGTMTTVSVSPFPSRASSRAEAVTAVNPAFLDDNDIPVTKL